MRAQGTVACGGEQDPRGAERAAPGHVDAVRRMVFDGISAEDLAVFTRVVDAITERVEAQGGETPRCPSMRGASSAAV